MNRRFVPARTTARKKKRRKKKKKKKVIQWISRPVTTAAVSPQSRENLAAAPAGQGSARPGQARSPLLGHALSKERTPFSDKQAVGRVPAACF